MIPLPYVEKWTHTYPSWRQFIFKSYQKRMEELLETLDSIAFDQLEERLWNYLYVKKKENYTKSFSSHHASNHRTRNSQFSRGISTTAQTT